LEGVLAFDVLGGHVHRHQAGVDAVGDLLRSQFFLLDPERGFQLRADREELTELPCIHVSRPAFAGRLFLFFAGNGGIIIFRKKRNGNEREQVRQTILGQFYDQEYRGRRYYAGAGGSHHLFPRFQ
ncbi:MAG TPA: hypothetical protein PLY26_05590, partial [Ferruginibacter sp.]|nr:hypothetical protein [Ferruginibacter sp.]